MKQGEGEGGMRRVSDGEIKMWALLLALALASDGGTGAVGFYACAVADWR
jgi:hypothetical protein